MMQLRRYEKRWKNYRAHSSWMGFLPCSLWARAPLWVELKRHGEAIAALDRLLRQRPDYPMDWECWFMRNRPAAQLARPRFRAAEMIEGIRARKRVTTPLVLRRFATPKRRNCVAPPDLDAGQISAARCIGGEARAIVMIAFGVAYLSADFRTHPVGILMRRVEHQ